MDKELLIQEVTRTLDMEAASIAALESSIDLDAVDRLIRLIGDCKGKVLAAGCGTSAMAARKICHSLCCIERPAVFLTPSDAVHGGLGLLQPEDILLLVSKGGGTSELAQLIPACRAKGATLVSVTENPDSILGRAADLCLKVKVEREPCPFNMLATASTLAVIAVFDAVCIALMKYTHYTREQFAVIHPGGAVGRRLLEGLGKKGESK